jgi:hypothetical protein
MSNDLSIEELLLMEGNFYTFHYNGVEYENIEIMTDPEYSFIFTEWSDIHDGFGCTVEFRLRFNENGILGLDLGFKDTCPSYRYNVNGSHIYITEKMDECDDTYLIRYLESRHVKSGRVV